MSTQEHIDPASKDQDDPAIAEYEAELALYEAELQKARELACAEEWVKRKAESVQLRAEELGYMSGAGALRLGFPPLLSD